MPFEPLIVHTDIASFANAFIRFQDKTPLLTDGFVRLLDREPHPADWDFSGRPDTMLGGYLVDVRGEYGPNGLAELRWEFRGGMVLSTLFVLEPWYGGIVAWRRRHTETKSPSEEGRFARWL